jgi:hypothetical protein
MTEESTAADTVSVTDQSSESRNRARSVEPSSTVERLIALIQKRSPIALIYLIATSISACTIVAAAGIASVHWYDNHFRWQEGAETTLPTLQAGYNYSYFTELLGTPVISRAIPKGYTESVFKGRGYYVETLTSHSNEVDYYETTICDSSIKPTFPLPGLGHVTLNHSAFASIPTGAAYQYDHGSFGLNGGPFMREFM